MKKLCKSIFSPALVFLFSIIANIATGTEVSPSDTIASVQNSYLAVEKAVDEQPAKPCDIDPVNWFHVCGQEPQILNEELLRAVGDRLKGFNSRADGIRLYTAIIAGFEVKYDASINPSLLSDGFKIDQLKQHTKQFDEYKKFDASAKAIMTDIQAKLKEYPKTIVHLYRTIKVTANKRDYVFHQTYVLANSKELKKWEIIRTNIAGLDRKTTILDMTDRIIKSVEAVVDRNETILQPELKYQISCAEVKGWSKATKPLAPISLTDSELVNDYAGIFDSKQVSDVTTLIRNITQNTGNGSGGKMEVVLTDNLTSTKTIDEVRALTSRNDLAASLFWFHINRKDGTIQTEAFYSKGIKEQTTEASVEGLILTQLQNSIGKIFKDFGEQAQINRPADLIDFLNVEGRLYRLLGSLLDEATIPDTWWDASHTDYVFGKWGKIMFQPVTKYFSFTCGVWNGVIGNLKLIPMIGVGLTEIRSAFFKILVDDQYRSEVLTDTQYLIDNREEFIDLAYEVIGLGIDQAKKAIVDAAKKEWTQLSEGNVTRAYYFAGQVTVEVAIAWATAGSATLTKVGLQSAKIIKLPVEFLITFGKQLAKPVAWLIRQGIDISIEGGEYLFKQGKDVILKASLSTALRFTPVRYIDDMALSAPAIEMRIARQGAEDEVLLLAKDSKGNVGVLQGAGRFIANTGIDLKIFLKNVVNKPIGKTYNGKFYKSVSKNAELNYNAKPDIISQHSIDEAWGRYDVQGESAMYYSKTFNGNQTEMSHYGDWNSYSTYEFSNVQIDNLLDLTDDIVRQSLGTEFDKLVLGMSNKTQAYEFTNVIGTWAREKGYKGLIVPGARGAKDYSNVVVFNQSELTSALNGITPVKLK
jgi:RES domain-containing protein